MYMYLNSIMSKIDLVYTVIRCVIVQSISSPLSTLTNQADIDRSTLYTCETSGLFRSKSIYDRRSDSSSREIAGTVEYPLNLSRTHGKYIHVFVQYQILSDFDFEVLFIVHEI